MKQTIIIILIVACVGVTWYIANTTERLTPQAKSAAENALLAQPEFPARPVWWHDDAVMAIGVVKGRVNPHHAANKACQVLKSKGVTTVSVEVYDVVKIQQEDDWEKLAASNCQ
ncbi:MAG: hypothetical protein CSA60_04395 [Neptuniibacter caesariensis]|uniref:BON domain-containing protein n=1 Tax=Neptuniibacter caesariensis TaxID=207954 RepID=A0A2G6JJC3_NEPCE|nr:MAG: hypothetical protein CSA60_04395 [Neptuniibacter caesariensis]